MSTVHGQPFRNQVIDSLRQPEPSAPLENLYASQTWPVVRGLLCVVPSWQPFSAIPEAGATDSDSGALDLFRFTDAPIFEKLGLNRSQKDT